MRDEEGFFNAVASAAELVDKGRDGEVLLVTHYDADGIAAASILASALAFRKLAVHLMVLEQLTPSAFSRLKRLAKEYPLLLMADMGSGALRALSTLESKVIVLDHHLPEGREENVVDVNPHHYGIDGSVELSSAGIAYFLAKELEPERAVMWAPLAIVGALGDRQDVDKHFKLTGLNRTILSEALTHGLVEERIDLRIFGGGNRPLIKALAYTTDPFLPGITGDEGGALAFLKSIGIEPSKDGEPRSLKDLSMDERRRLASELVKRLLMSGYSVAEAERIYGATYLLLTEPEESPLHDAREFAQLLNATGRMERHEIAIAIGMGARGDYLLQASEIAGQYRLALAKAFKSVREEEIVSETKLLIVVDLRGKEFLNEKMSGAIASLLASSIKKKKILLVLLDAADGIKVSARKCTPLEVNLGEIMSKAAEVAGGVGGGHENAAGATIPPNKLEDFLEAVEKVISNAYRIG